MVASPNPTTANISTRPGRCHGGRRVVTSAIASAPAPGAARSQPRPAGPTPRMSLAKIGSSATAPPNSTPNRSSVMAARNSGLSRTNRKPANTSLALRRLAAGGGRRTGMVDSIATNTSCPTAASANATVAPPVAAITQAANRRAGDRRQLKRRRQPRVGVGELRRREQLRQDGVDRRRGKRARGADQRQQRSRSPRAVRWPRHQRQAGRRPASAGCARRCRCCGADSDRRRCRRRSSGAAPAPVRRRRPGPAPTDRRCVRRAASRPRR